MKKPALRRATKTTLLFVIAAMLFLAGLAGTTLGYFDGETDNAATYSGGWVFSPTNAGTPTTVGTLDGAAHGVTWTTPTTTGVQNYVLRETNMGTTAAACPAATTTYPTTVGTGAAPTTTGTATVPSADNGYFVCMQVANNWTPATWYSGPSNANATAFRVGLWPTTVTETNVSGNNSISSGDYVTITYNQNVSASGTVTVCTFTSGHVLVGDSGCGSASDTPTIGSINGATIGSNRVFNNSAISKPAANQVRITMGCTAACTSTTYGNSGSDSWSNSGTTVSSTATPALNPCTQSFCNVAPGSHF